MSFLTLNGYAIPCVGLEEQHLGIGFGMARAYDGTALREVRKRKRKWTFRSKPLKELDALALIALVHGRGHKWSYGNGLSASGLYPSTDVATYRATAADGHGVKDENGTYEYGFGSSTVGQAGAIESGTTNVLNAIATNGPNICTGTDTLGTTGGFTTVTGAPTVTSNTADGIYWQGTRSLKIITTAAAPADEVRAAFGTVSANATVTGTVYVYGSGSVTLRLWQNSGAPAVLATASAVSLPASTWRRISVTGTLTGGNTTCAISLLETVSASNITFYCDGFQIEEKAYATSWVAGTRAAGGLVFTAPAFVGWTDVTMNLWTVGPTSNPTGQQVLCYLGAAASYVALLRPAASNSLRMDSPSTSATYATSPWNNNWHMVTGVARVNPESGETGLTVYFDGVSVATGGIGTYTGLSAASALYLGSNTAPSEWWDRGRIDSTRIVPYAASAAEIAAWYTTQDSGSLPRITAAGDFVPDTSVTVMGRVTHVSNTPHFTTLWRGNGRVVEFCLEEI